MKEIVTKVDMIYERLLDDIASGAYTHGERLIISKIAKDNHVSEIPVREAIRRLTSEGYVNFAPNQGATVNGFDREAVAEIFLIKGVLEGYATRESIDYLAPKDIANLRQINAAMLKAVEEGDDKQSSRMNIEFHLSMYRVIPQKLLYEMINDLWKKYRITASVFAVAKERGKQSVEEHELILRLIEARDYDGVEKLVRAHKFNSGDAMLLQGRQGIS